MASHFINVIARTLTYTARHECVNHKTCGSSFRASYTLWEVHEPALTIAVHLEADLRTRVPDIPVGWEMNGRDKLTCPECRRKAGDIPHDER